MTLQMTLQQACKILNVDITSHPDVIKRAYKRLAKIYHPDRNKQASAKQKYLDVNDAFERLKNIQEEYPRLISIADHQEKWEKESRQWHESQAKWHAEQDEKDRLHQIRIREIHEHGQKELDRLRAKYAADKTRREQENAKREEELRQNAERRRRQIDLEIKRSKNLSLDIMMGAIVISAFFFFIIFLIEWVPKCFSYLFH